MSIQDKEKAHIERSKKLYKVLGILLILLAVTVVAAIIYIQSLSPAYLFINDTDERVNMHVIGGTSPGVRVNLAAGEKQVVDMSWWWGKPQLPDVKPKYDLLIYKVFYLSTFPEEWLD